MMYAYLLRGGLVLSRASESFSASDHDHIQLEAQFFIPLACKIVDYGLGGRGDCNYSALRLGYFRGRSFNKEALQLHETAGCGTQCCSLL